MTLVDSVGGGRPESLSVASRLMVEVIHLGGRSYSSQGGQEAERVGVKDRVCPSIGLSHWPIFSQPGPTS